MKKNIAFCVISAHLLALLSFVLFSKAPQISFEKPTLKVETVRLKPSVTPAPTKTQPQKKKPPPPKKKTAPVKKKKNTPSKEIKAAVAAIEKSTPKTEPTQKINSAPRKITLEIDQPDLFRNDLCTFLHKALRLPEYGEVTIEFEIGRDGKVVEMKVLKSKSTINQQYIEKELPKLQFPIPSSIPQSNKLSYVLTFCNELSE